MRLTSERAKQAMLHPEQHVRQAAVNFFTGGPSQDREIAPLVIQAIELYGQQAFESYTFLIRLHHTPETVEWMIRQISTIDQPQRSVKSLWVGLVAGLRLAEPHVLKHYLNDILNLHRLDAKFHDAVQKRVYLLNQDPDSIWSNLEDLCQQFNDDTDPPDEQVEHADRLAEALGRHPEQMAERVMTILNSEVEDYQGTPMLWMEWYAVQMAGLMRLEEAVPRILEILHQDDDWTNNECVLALTQIGTDAVVQAIAKDFPTAEWGFCFHAASLLGEIHSDLCVQKCFELLESADDDLIRRELYKALLINGATAAIEPVRELLLEPEERNPDWLEFRSHLVTAATIMEVDFPELNEWKGDMQHDTEFRKKWYAEHVLSGLDWLDQPCEDDFEEEDEGYIEEDDEADQAYVPSGTIITSERPGRNDPCPCGSGKKYKKCCLRMEKGAPLN